jgi:conjugative relaxase-like TrwC/TraI family protein
MAIMLNVTAQRSAEGAKAYFAKSDYYSEGQELVGNWGGKGAILLGLFGEVEKRAFENLCDNLDPRTQKPLTPITRGNRRTGYDFTWSAPKSVSVVHAMTGDERIVQAFRDSIDDTMSEMEQDMQTRVRKGRVDHDRTSGNLVWAEFYHLTSRPVNGLPCPQLHSHCFAFNATYDAVESKWKAGQFGKIKGDGYYWQAVQQARFANRLQRLGYSIHKTKDAFEISGIPDSALKKFSLRTRQIEQVAEKLGITDPKVKAKLAATTREAKLDSIPYPELVERWNKLLEPSERVAILEAEGNPQKPNYDNAVHARFAADHLFERASVIDERRLLALALRHGIGEVTPEGVRAEANKLGLLKREENGKVLVTTPEVLAEERRIIQFAVSGKGFFQPIAKGLAEWQDELARSRLSVEQQAAVTHLLTSPDGVMILRGVAGAGKTTLTQEAVRYMEAGGKHVVMLAPSARASRGVLRSEGFSDADTLARFLVDEKAQARAKDGVVWLDEAGLVGTKSLGKLFDVAKKLAARVILAGDKKQLSSVERGSGLRILEEVAGLKIAEVTEIRRQSGEYKEAVKLLTVGKTAEGFAKLDSLGWIEHMPIWDSYEPVAKDYVEKFKSCSDKKDGVAIICPTHAEGAKITAAVREELKAQGLVSGEEREFVQLVPTQWTEAERADPQQYTGEEILQLHRNSGDFKAGERVRAADAFDSMRPPKPANFAAFRQDAIRLAKGDLIRIAANGKTRDGRHKVDNGATYFVKGFTPAGDITLSNGWVLDKGFATFTHGVVNTIHAGQGRTVQHVIGVISADSYPATSREGFYVSASRGRKSLKLFTDDKRGLLEAVQRSQPRVAATELVRKPKPQLWRRMREHIGRMQLAAMVAAKAAAHRVKPEKELAYAR